MGSCVAVDMWWWIRGGGSAVVDIWWWISAAVDICGGGYLRRWISAISSAPGGCWTLAIKGGVRDVVCTGGCWTLQSKGGCAISSARGAAGLVQLKWGCAISSARGRAGSLRSKGACAISSARAGLLDYYNQIKGGRAISSARRGAIDPCTQRGCARYRLQEGVRDIVCAGAAGPQSKGVCAILRDIVCAGTSGPLQSKGAYRISSAGGMLDCGNSGGGARYRLRGGAVGLLQFKGEVHGGCYSPIRRGDRHIVGGGCWSAGYRLRGGVLDQRVGGARYRLRGGGGGCWTLANWHL